MPDINILSEELINKIAAGEVIERPASVVKELVENSLDAGATKIKIEIADYGKSLIRVADNGEGMSQENALKSVLRHATSKIHFLDDLFAIQTLGFRGEALASIAAVSQLRLITKQKSQLGGFCLVLEGGKLVDTSIIAAEPGTIVEVKELFYNTPARKKFLKTDSVELKHILEAVTRYALINYSVHFVLLHNGAELLNSPSVEDWKSNLSLIYGLKLVKELLDVDYEEKGIKVSGFIVKPYQARNDKGQQIVFVNRRWVKNEEITAAVYDAYHSLLFVNKHPVFILNLDIDPKNIDVNVHPTKSEIKFEQKEQISKIVYTAVRGVLERNNLIPELELGAEHHLILGASYSAKGNLSLEKSSQTFLFPNLREKETYFGEKGRLMAEYQKLPPLNILGQLHKTFFVAETPGGMILIDQHVVQERVLYECYMEQLLNKRVGVQNLLQGELIELLPEERVLLSDNLNGLEKLGFSLEKFGENSFQLKTVPAVFGRLQAKELFYEVFNSLKEGKNKMEERQEEIITRLACRASIKAGDEITVPEIYKLLAELSQTKLPYTCPHGRAVLIKIHFEEIEKKFRRR